MSLMQRKRHVTRNARARKLVRDFFRFKEDCLNNNDLQVLNRTIEEITDIINDAQNDDEVDFYSDWSYSWDEDDIDYDFWELQAQEQNDEKPSDTQSLQEVSATQQDDSYYVLSRSEIEELLNKMPKISHKILCDHI